MALREGVWVNSGMVGCDGTVRAPAACTCQWQDGKKVIVWPEELAPGKPRFPTPPWSQRP
jgi:hypothetical protein